MTVRLAFCYSSGFYCCDDFSHSVIAFLRLRAAFYRLLLLSSLLLSLLLLSSGFKINLFQMCSNFLNLVKIVQICQIFFKHVQTCLCLNLSKFETCSNLSKFVQTCQNLIKLFQTSPVYSNLSKFFQACPNLLIFDKICSNLLQLVQTCQYFFKLV